MAEIAILLTDPSGAQARIDELQRRRRRAELLGNPSRFWSLGASVGTSLAEPWLTGTLHATFAPLRHSFIRVGCDVGFFSEAEGVDYFSITPFIHYALFLPFARGGGWHIGVGGGFLMEEYRFEDIDIIVSRNIPVMDFITGVNIGNMLDISYTLRTDFSMPTPIHKISVGFTHRFMLRSR